MFVVIKSYTWNFEGCHPTLMFMLSVSATAVGNGDGSDLFVEIREDNVRMFECDLGPEENCKVSALERGEGGCICII